MRANILAAPDAERARVAWSYELAGIVTTLAGVGLTLLGGALAIAGMSTQELALGVTGVTLIPTGYFVATFIGPALWAEGARF